MSVVWNLLSFYSLGTAAELSGTLEGVAVFVTRDRIGFLMSGREGQRGRSASS